MSHGESRLDAVAVEISVAGEAKRLARLAAPVILGNVGMVLLGVVDLMMVGRVSPDALASVALGNGWSFAVLIPALGTGIGLIPAFAHAYGAGDPHRVGKRLVQGAALLGVLAVPVLALHMVAGTGLAVLRQPAEQVPLAADYAWVVGWSVPAFLGFGLLQQLLQGSGRMMPATWATVAGNGVNIAANAVLIWGVPGMFDGLGAVGCAWATVASRYLMLFVLLAASLGPIRAARPRLSALGDLAAIGRLAAVAMPVGLQVALEVWAFSASLMAMGWIGKLAVDAHVVALSLASVAFMVPMGISSAASTRIGNLLGAGQPWGRAAWTAIGMGAAVMCVSATVFLVMPWPLARLYSPDLEVVALAAGLLPIAAAFQLFDGTQVVSFGVLRGAGDTALPAAINLVGYWVLGLPIGAWLAFAMGLGPTGIWVGMTLGLAIVAVLMLVRLWFTVRRGGYRVR